MLGSFLNQRAVAESLDPNANVALVCAGTDGFVTAEDVLFAGALVSHFQSRFDQRQILSLDLNDESLIAREMWRSWFGPTDGETEAGDVKAEESSATTHPAALAARLSQSRGGQNLIRAGYEADLQRCAEIDSVSIVPRRIAVRAGASIFGR
ncbi:2-phosphosulfolactate phosphatase [Rhodopirellula maiorica SM1]|uniref:Probable 2-phosphosulfolactate phosphatase n=1 Tax=Rhodopirellula maiorica SM1 TaxID=1265738 RepID=M5RZ49_9BACT|nr:2-phosphosulfolactate phosphatase [Rhodopirellula maiorica SM1]